MPRSIRRAVPVRRRPTVATLTVALTLLAVPAMQAAAAGPGNAAGSARPGEWSTSFEQHDPAPDGRPALTGGRPDVSGVTHPGESTRPGLRLTADDGPDKPYTAKPNAGFSGLGALHYAGRHTADGRARASAVIARDVRVRVGPRTRLSYLVLPDFDEQKADNAGSFVAVDLVFTDGARLSGLPATDQNGDRLTARDQGEAKTVFPQQWNRRVVELGRIAAGRTVAQVLLTYDGPKGPVDVGGWVDDVALDPAPKDPRRDSPADWVNTLRGTQSNGDYSRGNNFPAVAVPNGFNFWTPVTDAGSLSTLYSYHQQNNAANRPELQAFSVSHETSIWMGDRQTFQVMPSVATGVPDADRKRRALSFEHQDEVAKPHQYGVTFTNGLRAEMAPTDHAAILRFTFPRGTGRKLVFDNVDDRSGLTIDPVKGTVSGWSETRVISTGMTRMFVYGTFDTKMTGSGMLAEGNRPSTGYAAFEGDDRNRTVTLRLATSLIGVAQARRNLEQEIRPADTVQTVAARAKAAWNERLRVVEVEGATEDQLTTLYSNLYRVHLYPNSGHENVGTPARPRYRHAVQSSGSWGPPASTPTETGARIADGKVYVNTGFWDTSRAAWPAYSLLTPKVAGELVDGFVQQYRDNGWISPWSSPGYARVMTGTNSDAAFADAYLKSVPGLDARDTYDAALKNATVRPTDSSVGRDNLERSTFLGYVPNDVPAGFSWSMDGYVNDFAVSAMARKLATEKGLSAKDRDRLREEAAYLLDRSAGYTGLYDAETGFFQGRSVTGEPTTPKEEYDPQEWGNDHDYTEANGWNEAFSAPHDGEGLASVYGGRAGLAAKLDAYFATPEKADRPGSYGRPIHEMRETRDLQLGQWSIPNQVSHHIPWLYAHTQQPWKGQQVIRAALDRGWLGSDVGQGYPGDEDNGATSAWWVLSALGIYPLQTSSGSYVIGSPLFEKATLNLPGGKLVIEAPGTSQGRPYVQALTVDGKRHDSTAISHAELANGGRLRFTMGDRPSAWGTGKKDVPVSPTAPGQQPKPLHDLTGPGRGTPSTAAGEDATGLFDNTSATSVDLTGVRPTLTYRVNGGAGVPAAFYTLTSSDRAASQDPKSWVLEGSNDGKRWTQLDRRQKETFRWRGQTRPFQVDQPRAMAQYRLRITEGGYNGTSSRTSLAEVELLPRQALPQSPLEVAAEPMTLRPGGKATTQVEVRNTSTEAISPALEISAPSGWVVTPASASSAPIAPGETSTTSVEVTAPADAAPGAHRVRATATWRDWTISADANARVVGDVSSIEPDTDEERDILVENKGSGVTGDGADGRARYADGAASFTYHLPVPSDARGTITLDLANQYDVQVSSDREHWTTVLTEPDPVIFQSNRAEHSLDLTALRQAAGNGGSELYLRIADSQPDDGWGGWLAGLRLETSG